ncbi:MAG: phosphatase PAP2 family protein [Bacteroidetes bacterium]|nr:phosphatase PAP2 family protein [Bacteroidota bacterium]
MRKLLVAFCLLFAAGQRLSAQNIDYSLLRICNIDGRTATLDNTSRFFSNGNVFFITGAPVLLLADGFFRDDPQFIAAGKNALVSLGVSTVVTFAMKSTFKRHRPFETYPNVVKLSSGGGSSFPSGHTSSAFSVATSLSMSFPRWYVIVPSYLWATSVGISRVVLGVHYPSDVLAGALVGMGSAYVTHKAGKWLQGRKGRHSAVKTL